MLRTIIDGLIAYADIILFVFYISTLISILVLYEVKQEEKQENIIDLKKQLLITKGYQVDNDYFGIDNIMVYYEVVNIDVEKKHLCIEKLYALDENEDKNVYPTLEEAELAILQQYSYSLEKMEQLLKKYKDMFPNSEKDNKVQNSNTIEVKSKEFQELFGKVKTEWKKRVK